MKKILGAALLLISCFAWADDVEDGIVAYARNEYAIALAKFQGEAKNGNAIAQAYLGHMYRRGQGVLQDYALAYRWTKLAAEQGNMGAQAYLGLMYGAGQGVPEDFVKAHMWANLAAAQGSKMAVEDRNEVSKLMTPQQIAEAQKLARECLVKQYKNCD